MKTLPLLIAIATLIATSTVHAADKPQKAEPPQIKGTFTFNKKTGEYHYLPVVSTEGIRSYKDLDERLGAVYNTMKSQQKLVHWSAQYAMWREFNQARDEMEKSLSTYLRSQVAAQ